GTRFPSSFYVLGSWVQCGRADLRRITNRAWQGANMTDVEGSDAKNPFDRLNTQTALVVMLCGVAVFFLFTDPAKGRAAAISVAMILTVVWLRWDLRKHVWFWVTIILLALLHVLLVLFVPWSNIDYPGVVLLPQSLFDLAALYGCIKLVEKVVNRSYSADALS
ncbi:MAG TPA: hypothetical protein VFL96_11075, partial [Acidobacteriaceae bacterium]|nr:hypothetical protein [Acidobacteriaceae bacterium]